MLRRKFQRFAHILHRLFQRLLRQAIHQVKIDIVEMLLRNFHCAPRLICIVNAA